jgi:cytoskeleton protein RodZ
MSTKKHKRGVLYRAGLGKSPHKTTDAAEQLTIFGVPPMITENNNSDAQQPITEQIAPPADDPAVFDAAPPAEPASSVAEPQAETFIVKHESLGQRLRAAREARGLTCEAAAQRLRLPASVLQCLEAERFDRIGHAVYLRSYLQKYLQLLDLPQVLAERVVSEYAAPPAPLVTTGTVSRPRYLFDRYSGSALYLILTGVIVVPAVLLAMRAGFDQNLVRVAPLDTPELNTSTVDIPNESAAATSTANNAQSPGASSMPNTSAPFIASMTPFPAPAAAAAKPAEAPANPGQHKIRLNLGEASWVEIVAADGQKLEYGLLPAGSARDYTTSQALDVRIGNTNGATLEIDGAAKDLAPYRHSNVAHFKVADGETSTAAHSGG